MLKLAKTYNLIVLDQNCKILHVIVLISIMLFPIKYLCLTLFILDNSK